MLRIRIFKSLFLTTLEIPLHFNFSNIQYPKNILLKLINSKSKMNKMRRKMKIKK